MTKAIPILETLTNFLDTCPDFDDASIEFGKIFAQRDSDADANLAITIDGEKFLVSVQRVN